MELLTIGKALASHWPALAFALIVGGLIDLLKRRAWTKARAEKSTLVWWLRASLPVHAALIGVVLGTIGWAALGSAMPASPGVSGFALVLYYGGAGAASSWIVGGVKHYLEMRGISIPAVSMPGDPPSDPPPETLPTGQAPPEPPHGPPPEPPREAA